MTTALTLWDPQRLYELWERQPWSAHAIGLEQDAEDWAALPDEERWAIGWALGSFLIAEERVADQFTGLVRAAESHSEEAFLTTQLVDEARHVQHFARFCRDVVGVDGTFDDAIDHARTLLTPPFVVLFDEWLVDAHERLLADPTDLVAKVEFVTLYHMVIEGMLALTGQHFLSDHFERREILPGCTRGLRNISQDEHRHVAYGSWLLQQKVADPRLERRVRACLERALPLARDVLVPPGADAASYTFLGYSGAEQQAFAFGALSRRLKLLGIGPVES